MPLWLTCGSSAAWDALHLAAPDVDGEQRLAAGPRSSIAAGQGGELLPDLVALVEQRLRVVVDERAAAPSTPNSSLKGLMAIVTQPSEVA